MATTINLSVLSDNQKERFTNAFYANWPNSQPDTEAQNPWGCPWLTESTITVDGTTPEEWAQSYWTQVEEEIFYQLEQEEAEQE